MARVRTRRGDTGPNRRTYPLRGGLSSMTSAQRGAATFQEREDARLADARMRVNRNPNQAVWITLGRGFGRRTGWLTNEGFYPSGSYLGSNVVPSHGAVITSDGRQLDLKTGEIRPYPKATVSGPVYLMSYASAESKNIVPRDEIIGTLYDPAQDKILAFGQGHTFSHVGRNIPREGYWKTYHARVSGVNNFGIPYDEVINVSATSEDTARQYVLGKTREYDKNFSEQNISDLGEGEYQEDYEGPQDFAESDYGDAPGA